LSFSEKKIREKIKKKFWSSSKIFKEKFRAEIFSRKKSKKKIREQKFFKENLGEREPSRKYLKKNVRNKLKNSRKNYKRIFFT